MRHYDFALPSGQIVARGVETADPRAWARDWLVAHPLERGLDYWESDPHAR